MTERCSVFWPFNFIGDRNRCFCEVEKKANNIDSRWGEKDEFPYKDIADSWAKELEQQKYFTEYLMKLRELQEEYFAKGLVEKIPPIKVANEFPFAYPHYHHHDSERDNMLIDLEVDDVDKTYGYSKKNAAILEEASHRVSMASKALGLLLDSNGGVTLEDLNKIYPLMKKSMNALLSQYLNSEIKKYTEVAAEANKYIYGEAPVTPEPSSPDETTDSGDVTPRSPVVDPNLDA